MKKTLVITLLLSLSGFSYAMDSNDPLKKTKSSLISFANVYTRMAEASEYRLSLKQQILDIKKEMFDSGYDREKQQKILELQQEVIQSKKKQIEFGKSISKKIQDMIKESNTLGILEENRDKVFLLVDEFSLKLGLDKKN